MYCILLASMKASTLLLINVTVSTLSWACPCSSEDPWGLLAAPSSLFCHKTQSSLVTQEIFHLIFMLAFVFLKAMFIHIDLHFSQTKTENILLREVESYGCFQFYSYHLPISSNFSTISMHSYAVKFFLIKFLN